MKRLLHAWLAIASLAAAAPSADAVVIGGIELTDYLVVDAPAGASLDLSTTEDIYVFSADVLTGGVMAFDAGGALRLGQSITALDLSLCSALPTCRGGPYDLARDLAVVVRGVLGDVSLRAAGAISIGREPVPDLATAPEPWTAPLLAAGVAVTALRRRRREPRAAR